MCSRSLTELVSGETEISRRHSDSELFTAEALLDSGGFSLTMKMSLRSSND